MNLKQIFFLALLLSIFTGSLQAEKWTIGMSLAGMSGTSQDDSLNNQLENSGLNATASSPGSIRLIWQLFASYHFSSEWSAELAYLDLGKAETSFTGTAVDIDTFLNSAQEIHPQTAQGFVLSANHFFAIDHDTRLKLRAGMYSWAADYTLQGDTASRSVKQSGTDISFGASIVFGRCYKTGTLSYISFEQTTVDETDFPLLGFGFGYCFR
ncbi:MAG: hypothetical protein OEY36_08825 [Gammaproteobacteria bacterium]|nr:hypothetical protein [Gammaproteobacteria bacterium]